MEQLKISTRNLKSISYSPEESEVTFHYKEHEIYINPEEGLQIICSICGTDLKWNHNMEYFYCPNCETKLAKETEITVGGTSWSL